MSNTFKFKGPQWIISITTKLSAADLATKLAAGEVEFEMTSYNACNPDPASGEKRFYEVGPGKYGEPLLFQEPSRKIALPSAMQLVDGQDKPLKADDLNAASKMLVGYVLYNEQNQVTARMSLTNAASKGIVPVFKPDGTLMIGGRRYSVCYLVTPDKNRMKGQVGYCWPLDDDKVAPPITKVIDLEDITFERR